MASFSVKHLLLFIRKAQVCKSSYYYPWTELNLYTCIHEVCIITYGFEQKTTRNNFQLMNSIDIQSLLPKSSSHTSQRPMDTKSPLFFITVLTLKFKSKFVQVEAIFISRKEINFNMQGWLYSFIGSLQALYSVFFIVGVLVENYFIYSDVCTKRCLYLATIYSK